MKPNSGKHRWAYWAAAAALCVGNLFLHKPISDVCDWLSKRFGFASYDRAALLTIALIGVLSLAVPAFRFARRRPALSTVLALAGLGTMSAAAQHWMLVANIELIHLPQYALLATIFLFAGMRPATAWLTATGAGVADEIYQYLVIYAATPGAYLDYNDMILNALGAAWPLLLLANNVERTNGRATESSIDPTLLPAVRPHMFRLVPVLVLGLGLASYLDPPRLHPLLSLARSGRMYRVLSAPEAMLIALLLWGMVRGRRGNAARDKPERRRKGERQLGTPLIAVALLVGLAAGGCAGARPLAPDPPTARRPFILTFWCGPPLSEFTDARAEEIARAGFNIVGPPCEGSRGEARTLRALDIAERHGLRMWIGDSRFGEHATEQPGWKLRLREAVAAYRNQPALDAYFVDDEPAGDEFQTVASVVELLRASDPHRFAYVNLFPDYAVEHVGKETYREYVQRFIRIVRPRLLSYDHYPFGQKKDRSSFFKNLTAIREAARKADIPFMLVILAMPHGPYRDPTEAELAWQVFHAMAFGARGISYFAYWTPVNVVGAEDLNFHYGLIEDGKPTLHYFQAARLNRVVRAMAAQLASFWSVGVADSRGEVAPGFPVGPIEEIQGGDVTAGLFADRQGHLAVLLVNRSYRHGIEARLQLRADAAPPEVFDTNGERWRAAQVPVFTLAPGGARLLRWR